MRPAARDDDGEARELKVPGQSGQFGQSENGLAEPTEDAAPRPWASVVGLVRQSQSGAWPATLLMVFGLLALGIESVLLLTRANDVHQSPEVPATAVAVRPTAAAVQALAQAVLADPAAAPTAIVAPTPTPFVLSTSQVNRSVPTPAAPLPPQPPVPRATPTSELTTASPQGTVRAFYDLLGHRDFHSMVGLFSGKMYDTMPSDAGVLRDRTPPGQLFINKLTLVSVDQAGDNATVAVDVVEQLSGAEVKRYVGIWKLVRGPAGWLLDEPDIHLE